MATVKQQNKTFSRLINRRRAIVLRLYSGLTYDEIADTLDVSKSTIFRWINEYELHLHKQTIDDLKKVRLQKYRELQDVFTESRERGDLQTAIQAIKSQIDLLRLNESESSGANTESETFDMGYVELSKEQVAMIEGVLNG